MIINITLPQSWNDLTVKQCLTAYGIIMAETGLLFDEQELVPAKRILLLQALSGLTDRQLRQWRISCLEEDPEHGEQLFLADLSAALHTTDFLFEISKDSPSVREMSAGQRELYAIALTRTKNPFPALDRKRKNGKTRSYYAPADLEWFSNMEFLELCTTFSLFESYIQTHNNEALHQLLAVLYRPVKPRTKENRAKNYGGDKRQPYLHHEATVKKRAHWMATLDERVKQLIVFWFASCRQAIIQQYPDLFSGGGGQGSKYGWGALLMAMAGGLHQMDAVSAQPASDALAYLDYLNEQAKQQKLQENATT